MSKNAGYTLKIKADSGYRSEESGRTDAECYRVALAALDGQLGTDVNLLKSAPELLESVRELLVCMSLANWENDPIACKARAAIAKATGGDV